MVFFVYGVHIHLILLLQYTGPIYICLVLLQLRESTVSGIITCIDTDGIWSPLNRSSFPGVHILLHQYNLLQYQSGK